jgi:hypothetical protein
MRNISRARVLAATVAVLATTLTVGAFRPAAHDTHPGPQLASASASASASAPAPVERVCPVPTQTGHMTCMALMRTGIAAHKGVFAADTAPSGYGPADLSSAYNLPSATAGSGATVAIIDAYDDPNAEADLGVYRAQYGLPACTTANGCFKKVAQDGSANYPPTPPSTDDWTVEESLDIDMVSAICPNCHILLVEANSTSIDDLGTAVDEAVALGAQYVSNSYGSNGEDPSETGDDKYYNHPGVVVTAAAGDDDYGVVYPAASPYVTSVGGTSLVPDASVARGWTETVWGSPSGVQGTGSGCSQYEPKPSWQTDTGCAQRTVADVSAVADPNTGVAIYDSWNTNTGWGEVGGTSVATPIIASTYALAGAPQAGTLPAQYPYDAELLGENGLNDVTSGANGTCTPAYLCTAGPGYDGPTGLGTPWGVSAFTFHAHGVITGTVTDSATGAPVADANVDVGASSAVTDAGGHYTLTLPVGSYQLTVSDFGYVSQTATVDVTTDTTTTQDFALSGAAHETVSGTVTAADGQPWPLYAKVDWSDGNGHGGTVFTDPATGGYSLSLAEDTSYTLQVSAVYPGYEPATRQVTVAASGVTADVGLGVDMLACSAIGYQSAFSGAQQGFDGTKAPAGWRVVNTSLGYPGYAKSPGWVFTNPAGRANNTGGSGNFAIVDSDHSGAHHYQDTTLVTPVTDLTGDTSPQLEFSTDLQPAINSTATVEVSVDGGKNWTPVWSSAAYPGAPGPRTVVLALPQAAGKPQVQARFTYLGEWSQYWEIDDVFLGNRTCAQQQGGLVIGRVTDAKAGTALDGATVSGGGGHAVTVDTPGDDTIGGGFYWLFTASGQQQLTATMTGYTPASSTIQVTAGKITRQDFTLTAS